MRSPTLLGSGPALSSFHKEMQTVGSGRGGSRLLEGTGSCEVTFGEQHPGSCMAALCWQLKYSLLAAQEMDQFFRSAE